MSKKEYVITNGSKYIKQSANGKFTFTTNSSVADIWNNKKTAESIINNSIPPYMRFELYVAEIKDGNVAGYETLSQKQISDCRKDVCSLQNATYKLGKYSFDEDNDLQDMIKGFEDVLSVLNKYANNHTHKQLEEKTMTMNLIVEDIKHYHGKKSLNARDGFKLCKLEDKAIIKRISTKNQLEISKKLLKYCKEMLPQIEDICATIEEIKSQEYKPRILVDLFENDNLDVEF